MKKILDFTPKEQANLSKLISCVREVAQVNKAYYDSLVEQGFTKQEALDLVKSFISRGAV